MGSNTTIVNVSSGGGGLVGALVGVALIGGVASGLAALAAAVAAVAAAIAAVLISLVWAVAAVACTGIVCWTLVRRAQIRAEILMAREAHAALAARTGHLVIDASPPVSQPRELGREARRWAS